jgi:hypothetical protein
MKLVHSRDEFMIAKREHLMTRLRWYVVACMLLAAVAAAACGSDKTAADNAGETEEMGGMAMGAGPEGLDTANERMSDEGLFHVSISSNLEPLGLNEMHSWTIHVETADGQSVENAQIAADGGMPEHNHGFPTAPEVTEDLGGGDYLLEGVKFSMAGWWELKLDITSGEQSDQVTFNIILP